MDEETQTKQKKIFSTPMMKQYQEIKEQHQDCLLFFRLGDFYELFCEDAKVGAQILNITLTKRPRGKDGDIPMAGVPFHAADGYIAKLVRAGHKVAICEQMSEPDSKGIVEREVIRIVTPGTILDEKTLEKKEHNYTMSISIDEDRIGIAVADLSTGDFQTTELLYAGVGNAHVRSLQKAQSLDSIISNELARFTPAECIVSTEIYNNHKFLKILSIQKGMNVFPFASWNDLSEDASKIVMGHFKIKSLQTFGIEDKPHALISSATLLGYLGHTQKDRIDHIKTIKTYSPEEYVILDRSTIANLELFTTIREQDQRGSFIQVLDKTSTAMGGRMLRTWLRKPLTQKDDIERRLDTVEEFLKNRMIRENLKVNLKQIWDIPRILSRLSVGIGNAYDLVNLKTSLKWSLGIKNILSNSLHSDSSLSQREVRPPALQSFSGGARVLNNELSENKNPLSPPLGKGESIKNDLLNILSSDIPAEIKNAINIIETNIVDDPPIDTKNGGMVRDGVNEELDQFRAQVGGGKNWIAKLEAQEKEKTGISSLKIKYNQVFGYYIEISKANLQHVPKNYMRKQTMVSAERFITPELKEYEEKVVMGQDAISKLELKLFLKIVDEVLSFTPEMQKMAEDMGAIDCLINFAEIAEKNQYIKPTIVETGRLFLKDSRHPVVEKLQGNDFVPNDVNLNLDDHQLLVLTGPNMAGKSVFMRQVALVTLMAHMGCFVPAKDATISLVDRIFVRSGASDVIASGLSTFMVEMVETAHILNHATEKSLIIMDEIGRGTSTYDGISIAWAVAEYLVTNPKIRAKTLFATHYHELQMLEDKYPERIKNYNVAVQEKSDGEPIFLHKVIPGRSSHSYAIAVAKLAGVPEEVTKKATQLLCGFENKNNMDLNCDKKIISTSKDNDLIKKLSEINLHTMTPLDAMNKLAELQKNIDF